MQTAMKKASLMLGLALLLLWTNISLAADAGLVKTIKGSVSIERNGASTEAKVGSVVMVSDSVVTGPDGSVGIALKDGTLLSAGPNATLILNKFAFNTTTSKGELDASLKRGTLSVISGKISKASPETVTYRTPNAILGVRGTEFIIDAN